MLILWVLCISFDMAQHMNMIPPEFGTGWSLAKSHFDYYNEGNDNWSTDSFSHHDDKTPDESNLKKGGVTVTHIKRGEVCGKNGSSFAVGSGRWPVSLLPQSGVRKRWMLVDRSLFPSLLIQSETPAYGMMPPTFKVGFLSSVRALWKHSNGHSQLCVS